jgi:hypothetical protein
LSSFDLERECEDSFINFSEEGLTLSFSFLVLNLGSGGVFDEGSLAVDTLSVD